MTQPLVGTLLLRSTISGSKVLINKQQRLLRIVKVGVEITLFALLICRFVELGNHTLIFAIFGFYSKNVCVSAV